MEGREGRSTHERWEGVSRRMDRLGVIIEGGWRFVVVRWFDVRWKVLGILMWFGISDNSVSTETQIVDEVDGWTWIWDQTKGKLVRFSSRGIRSRTDY